MGCKKITYRNFTFLEVVHRKNATENFILDVNRVHLGNIRLSYTNNGTAASPNVVIAEENNYYPFGLRHKGYNDGFTPIGNSAAKKYKFNGVELNEDFGLNLYEMDFRSYDAAIGRFTSIDPLTEKMRRFSPYNFGWDNPLIFVDPDGLFGDFYDLDGNHLGNDGIDDDKVYTVEGTSRFSINDFKEGGKYQNNQTAYSENNGDGYSVNYEGTVSETKSPFTGEANSQNSKQADGQISLIQVLDNGKEFTKQSLGAVGGPYGNGAPPNGDYTVDGPRLRSESGFTRDGFGFSLNLNPTFETGRTWLRIHPDGNNTGTLGCVGIQCTGAQGRLFYNNVNSVINKNGALNMNINIIGNPNNQGGGFVPNINE